MSYIILCFFFYSSAISYQASFTVTETVLRHIKKEIPILSEPMDKIIQEVVHEKVRVILS